MYIPIVLLKCTFWLDPRWGPRVRISNKFPGDADTGSQAHTLRSEDLGQWFSKCGTYDHNITVIDLYMTGYQGRRSRTSGILFQNMYVPHCDLCKENTEKYWKLMHQSMKNNPVRERFFVLFTSLFHVVCLYHLVVGEKGIFLNDKQERSLKTQEENQ